MRQNPHVRICGGPGSATTLVYPTELWAERPVRHGPVTPASREQSSSLQPATDGLAVECRQSTAS